MRKRLVNDTPWVQPSFDAFPAGGLVPECMSGTAVAAVGLVLRFTSGMAATFHSSAPRVMPNGLALTWPLNRLAATCAGTADHPRRASPSASGKELLGSCAAAGLTFPSQPLKLGASGSS